MEGRRPHYVAAWNHALHALTVHARYASCLPGSMVKRLEVKGQWPKLKDRIAAEVPRPFSVCFEASCGYDLLGVYSPSPMLPGRLCF